MKIIFFLFIYILASNLIFSQENIEKTDELLTQKEAEIRIKQKTSEVSSLQGTLDNLKSTIQTKNDELLKLSDMKICNEDMMKLLGIREFDLMNFKDKFGKIENRVKEFAKMQPDELKKYKSEIELTKKEYEILKSEKSSLMPDVYDRVFDLSFTLSSLNDKVGKMVSTYTVGSWSKDRDCLWTIAAKDQTYSDPLMWPKIWQANIDKIRNPDVLKEGTELNIPDKSPKTNDELRAERLYWRKKKVASKRK
ncbi:MAG: LysM peptidoglycan-binding domain-containing protein [Chlorobiota bacterium]|nr:LysM peptidoglycan-binding domain-containing protein [Chlorobiota bacterium]QQS66201.1 MAG: LysM peptidoglycan-binding domain-containing protein [Chlorobiota bacterium]